jgi:malate synthase
MTIESLRAVVIALRAGAFSRHDIANEVEAAMNSMQRASNTTSGAKNQLRILADMLDDKLVTINQGRADYIASEIRKYLEWIE